MVEVLSELRDGVKLLTSGLQHGMQLCYAHIPAVSSAVNHFNLHFMVQQKMQT